MPQLSGDDEAAAGEGIAIFHAGTKRGGDTGYVTAGGRVVGVTASGTDVPESRARAYAAARKVAFEGVHYRNDIANRALEPR